MISFRSASGLTFRKAFGLSLCEGFFYCVVFLRLYVQFRHKLIVVNYSFVRSKRRDFTSFGKLLNGRAFPQSFRK